MIWRLKNFLIELLLALSELLNGWARRLIDHDDSGHLTLRLRYSFVPGSFITSDGVITMRLTTDQKLPNVSLEARTEPTTEFPEGRVATLDGPARFASSDESVARINQTGDYTAEVMAVGPGVAQITATADADLDAGDGEVREISATDVVEVVIPEAASLRLSLGEPQQQ